MPSSGIDPETLLIRTTVVSLALQSLIGRLAANGILDADDLTAMRETGLVLAADLQSRAETNAQVAGHRMAREVDAWWDAAATLVGQ